MCCILYIVFFIDYETKERTIIKYNLHCKEVWRHEFGKFSSDFSITFNRLKSIVISYKDQLLFIAQEYDSKEYVIYKISFNGELSEVKIKRNSAYEYLIAFDVDSKEKTIVLITENKNKISKYTYNGVLVWSRQIDNINLKKEL